MSTLKPVIGITMGDPSGIGPEIAVKALKYERVTALCRPLLIGSRVILADAGLGPDIDVLEPAGCSVRNRVYGKVSAEAGHAAFLAIEKAIALAQAGEIAAVVTGPIHKEAIRAAGHPFPGHTEMFAHYAGVKDYAMLLVYGDLRVVHVTTHVPLSHVPGLITKCRVLKVIELANEACRELGIERPRIGVAGLNPHAGDGGLFGSEEEQHIAPAVEAARGLGICVEGPIPPDTLFPKAIGGWFDVCVAMYHDQGHIPLKVTGFTWDRQNNRWGSVNGVNITLGLPIIRTSVDHGTAFDIAGKGIASPDSMIHAIEYAVRLVTAKTR